MDASDQRAGTVRRGIGLALIALMAFGAMAGGAAAHNSEDHGEVTIHDEPDGPSTVHVECDFWVKGHNITHEEGEIWLSHVAPQHSDSKHLGDFEGEADGDGNYTFFEGPFNFSHGEWGDHMVNARMDDDAHSTEYQHMNYEPCEDEDQPPEEEAEPPACPEDLRAQAHGDEDVTLAWNASANASTYHVHRASEDGQMTHVAQVNDTSYTDTETEAQTTYTYEVTAANEAGEAEDCPTAEVTAIPFFGNPALVALAAVGSVGAVAALRTRRG